MDIQNTILAFVALLNFLLGIIIYFQGRKRDPVNVSYGLFCLSAAFWAISIIIFRQVKSLDVALLWMKFAYVAAIGIATSFFYFALAFSNKKISIKKQLFIGLPFLVLSYVILFSPKFLIESILFLSRGKDVVLLNLGKVIYAPYFLGFFFGGLYIIWKQYKKSKELVKKQSLYILIGVLVPGILGTIFNLLFPFLGNHMFIWLGPMFSVIMIGFVAHAIAKHNLLNVKVIATEVFTLAIIFILFANIFTATDSKFRIIYIIIFVAVSLLGYLIIKSVLREVRAREEIERLAVGLEAANKRLAKLDKEKSEFLSIATHQLRTPMTVVKGYISMIFEGTFGQFGEKAKEALSKVYTSNERLIALIEDLLNISRIERGKMEYDFQPRPFEKLVSEIVTELKPVAERKGLKIIWQKPKGLPKVKFDESKMRQVVMNLIDNAIKYSSKGEINVGFESMDGRVRLSVKDTGAGISKEKIPLLFKRYSRVESKSPYTQHTQGMGLGLYVAKIIVDAHKGKIWAESEGTAKGSTFFVELPVN